MNSDVKQQWVDALASGEFKQGKYQLRDNEDYYDAGGVLCELAVRAGIIDEPVAYLEKAPDRMFFGYIYDGEPTNIPASVEEWAGIKRHQVFRIALMGDRGKRFDYIAEHIKENV